MKNKILLALMLLTSITFFGQGNNANSSFANSLI
jgi:hypothetical protein